MIQNYIYKILFSTRVYPIIPGGGTPIMILRQYVYVASINALFASSIPNKITPFQYKRNFKPPLYSEKLPSFSLRGTSGTDVP